MYCVYCVYFIFCTIKCITCMVCTACTYVYNVCASNYLDVFLIAAIDCGSPSSISNGNVDISSTTFNSRAGYRCNTGYQLQGSSTRTCQDNEQWSGQAPQCASESSVLVSPVC